MPISDLELNPEYLKKYKLQDNSFILKRIDLDRKNVPNYMEKYLKEKIDKQIQITKNHEKGSTAKILI